MPEFIDILRFSHAAIASVYNLKVTPPCTPLTPRGAMAFAVDNLENATALARQSLGALGCIDEPEDEHSGLPKLHHALFNMAVAVALIEQSKIAEQNIIASNGVIE